MKYVISIVVALALMVSMAWADMPEYMEVIEVNEFSGITFYAHEDYKIHPSLAGQLFPYISITENGVCRLRFHSEYEGESWIFFDRVQFVIDGERYEYEVQSWDKVTNVYGGGVSETVDYAMATKEIPILHGSEGLAYEFEEGLLDALLNAETVKVRLAGKQGNYDSTLREAQLERLQLTIQAYLDH